MGGNPHNPGGSGLGELPRVELEARVLDAERRASETLVAFKNLSERFRAEHDARVEAESGQFDLKMAMEALRDRAEQAERERDEWRDAAVYERDQKAHLLIGSRAAAAEARVVALEAALRVTAAGELAWLRGFLSDAYAMQQVKNAQDRLHAALAGGSDES